jgi:Flp pilus assembly protein TadD
MDMKRFLALALPCFLALAPAAWADGPDDDYVGIYNIIQQADSLNEKGQLSQAKSRYSDALGALKKFQTAYPDWNVKVVRYRLNYLSTKISQIMLTLSTPIAAPPAAAAPAVSPPPGPTPAQSRPTPVVEVPAPATPGATLSDATESQIKDLQDQVRRTEAERNLLQAKLKEALNAQPAAIDPRELTRAEDKIKELQKENDLLKTSLAEAKTNALKADPAALEQARQSLAEANKKVTQLTDANSALVAEKDSLLARMKNLTAPDDANAALRAENDILKKEVADLKSRTPVPGKASDLNRKLLEAQSQIAALQSDKEIMRLEKIALENRVKRLSTTAPATMAAAPAPAATNNSASLLAEANAAAAANDARIKELEAQRDELQKSLDAATKELQGRKRGKETANRIATMTQELASLHARIEVLEARQVPYTTEELALFKAPPNALVASARMSRKSKDIPAANAKLIADADRMMVSGQLDQAEVACLDLLKLDPKDTVVLGKLSAIQVELNHWDDAEKHIHQALAIKPDDAYTLNVLGQLRFRQKKYDDALDALGRAAKLNPQDAEIQNFLGLTLAEKGLRGPAETALRKAIQIDPGYGGAHNNLAVVYITQKPPLVELARWHYQKALASGHPKNPQLEKLLDASAPQVSGATQ